MQRLCLLVRPLSLVMGWCLLLAASPLAQAAGLKVGVAVTDITPPVGWRMSGYFYERVSTKIHDPLQGKALVFRQGDEKAALVFCDLNAISRDLSSRVRTQASRKTGIPERSILLAATHTHTGPLYFGALREYLHETAISTQGRDPCERINYQEILADRLVAVVVQADRLTGPARLEVCKTRKTGLSFNRRYQMKDGSVVTNPGKTNANVVRAAGPVDPELEVVLMINPETKRCVASLTSFALHPDTVGGTEYSGDFPMYLERAYREVFGPELISVFANGTCGNINHVNVSDPAPQKGQEEAARIGTALAGAMLNSFAEFKAIKQPALAIRSASISVPLQLFSREETEQALHNMPKVGGKELPFIKQVETYKIADLVLRGGTAASLEIQAFRLGPNTAIVGLPGEIFVEHGLAIKKASPFANTIIVELSNDSIGYVPTKKAFSEGAYEVVNSRVKPGGGEMLVEAAIKLLKELKSARPT